MLFAVFVVEGDVLLEAVGNVAVGDRYLAVGSADHDVEDVEQLAGVAACEAEQGAGLVHLDLAGLQLGVGRKGPVEKRFEVRVLHRFEHIDLTAAQQRRDHLERWVFGRGADQREDPLFDGSQQRVLLRLVEAVDFVDEQKGRFGVEEALFFGRFDYFAHVFHARRNGREREEGALELRGDDLREGGLAHARRAPEDERGHVARFEEFAEYAVRTDQMRLADVLVERFWAEAFCERSGHRHRSYRVSKIRISRVQKQMNSVLPGGSI